MLPVRRTPPGQYTGIPQAHPKTNRRPWFRSHLNIFRRVNGRGLTSIAHLPGPHLTRSQPRLFPRRSARQSLANAPRGGLKPPPRKAAPEDQTPSISSHSTTGQQALHQPLRLPPALVFTTGFDVICFSYDTSAVVHSRSPSRSPPDAITGAFSSSLTTTVFSQRSMRRFEASLRRATPKSQDPSSSEQHRYRCTLLHEHSFTFWTHDLRKPSRQNSSPPSASHWHSVRTAKRPACGFAAAGGAGAAASCHAA